MMKTKTEIIKETVAKYGGDPSLRGVKEGGGPCVYLADNGNRCAVGQYSDSRILDEAEVSVSFLARKIDNGLDNHLIEEVRGHDLSFWRRLQAWHDSHGNFTKTGLTEQGREYTESLLVMYKDQ